MKKVALYNGKVFPEFVFIRKDLTYMFIEFILVFDEPFLTRLKHFLNKYKISTIAIENLDPDGCAFYDEVIVRDLPASFIKSVSEDVIKTPLGQTPVSFQQITEQGVIYAKGNESLFTIFLNRDSWIAIIGLSHPEDIGSVEGGTGTQIYIPATLQSGKLTYSELVVSLW
ncbi:MAG TPA: hypothetical protein VD993_11305 [Chitinophagaceae bacterium]|nr:hypothetical protein [Chitinophagaceae bacterium]